MDEMSFDAGACRSRLDTRWIGRRLEVWPELESTRALMKARCEINDLRADQTRTLAFLLTSTEAFCASVSEPRSIPNTAQPEQMRRTLLPLFPAQRRASEATRCRVNRDPESVDMGRV